MKALKKVANESSGTDNGSGDSSVASSVASPAARNDVSKAGRNGSFHSLILPMKYDVPKIKKKGK